MRRYIQAIAVVVGLLTAAPAVAAPLSGPEALADRVLGNADAPVTIVDYSSLTCPHCARFHLDTLPRLKKEYIDTGKVRFIFRDFPFDRAALDGSKLARCVNPDRYYGFLDVLFKGQDQWSRAADPTLALSRLAKLAGLNQADIDACLADTALADGIVMSRMDGEKKYKVESTPTFIFNDGAERIEGARAFEDFAKVIDKLASKK